MNNKTFTILQGIALRFMLLGMLLLTSTIGTLSVVHAQGETIEAAVSLTSHETSSLINMLHEDDCDKDDNQGVTRNTGESNSEECHPQVWVTGVWTADGSLNPKASFVSGEPIQWVITLKNTKKHTVSVQLTYTVKDSSGKVVSSSEMTVSAKPGLSSWTKSSIVPDAAGTYSFTGSVKYRDDITRKSVKYEVGNPCHTLTMDSDPEGGGTVSANPAPDCNGGTQYITGTVVTLTVSANTGYVFSEWSGAINGSTNPATITMTSDETVIASFVEFAGLTAGIHDDTNPAWSYAGNWSTEPNAGYYNGTSHNSTTAGNDATVMIDGSQFILYFTGDTDHGNLDVYVDDVKIDTIDQFSATTVYRDTWTSPILVPGLHILKFGHVDGMAVNIDAIQICGVSVAVPAGTYDDNNCSWAYNGDWTAWTGSGPYNNTVHYTSTEGDYAELQFHGRQFMFTYTLAYNRGSFDVYVDDAYVTTINAYSPALMWQVTWTSPTYAESDHKVRFVHAGGAGTYMNIDAIAILP